jgi:glycosyl transferase family 4
MKILIANATLASLTGTETFVRDLAIGLLRRGHTPIVYAPELGEIARQLRLATVPVIDDLQNVGLTPDVIHGNHNTELMSALLHFPNVPAVFFCHSWLDWISIPPVHPRILAYVAVDETCRDRLLCEQGIPEDRVRLSLNSVDLQRFKPRPPLPDKPRRALVFSNDANEWTHLPAVKEACVRAGVALDVIGAGVKAENSQPEVVLGNYDLVFAKARCAIEALVVGAAVIVCDSVGSGPMVTSTNLEQLRAFNFGIRTQSEPVTVDGLLQEIARYDSQDAGQVSGRLRAVSSVETSIDDALAAYDRVVADFRNGPPPNPAEEARAAAAYLRWLTLGMRQRQAEYATVLGNSRILRMRNAIGRLSWLDRSLKRLGNLVQPNKDGGPNGRS